MPLQRLWSALARRCSYLDLLKGRHFPDISWQRRENESIVSSFSTASRDMSYARDKKKIINISWPSTGWSEESRQLFHKLNASDELRLRDELVDTKCQEPNRMLPYVDEECTGRFFNFALFHNERTKAVCGVLQLGAYTEGESPGCADRGAIALMCDCVTIVAAEENGLGDHLLTANLSVDYRHPIKINATYLLEGNVDKVVGKKVYSVCRIVSNSTDKLVHVEARALLINKYSSAYGKLPSYPRYPSKL